MKKILFFILIPIYTFAQSVCEPIGTTTNPNSPTNPQNQSFTNNFNWFTNNSYLDINSTCTPNGFTPNPFTTNQTELLPLSLSKDNKPEDGWEIVAYNLGYNNNNTPLNVRPEHSYYMLYNKYTGTLRVLVKWCRNINYNGALLTLKFAPGFQTNLLDMSNDEKALEIPHIANPSLSTSLKFYNDNNFWGYADFKLNYDPCTCSFEENSRLLLYTELISNSSVELTGKINGTITSIADGSGSTNSDGNFWKTANNINNKMMNAHKGIENFTEKYQKIYKDLADAGITINAINKIGDFFKNNAFMKAGLKALPEISKGVKFISGLFGGGASGQQPIQLAPLSVNLDVKLKGTINTQDPMHNVTIGLPGSKQQNALQGVENGQPLYNETLGVFALINQPVMYYTETITPKGFLNREKKSTILGGTEYWEIYNEYDFITRNYKLSGETLKYAINPASKLALQDAEIMLITEYEKPSLKINKSFPNYGIKELDIDTANGLNIPGTDMGPIIDDENFIFQNSFKPIGTENFKNDYSFSYLNEVKEKVGLTYNRKRRLKYSSTSLLEKWSCYAGGSALTCQWNPDTPRPFKYIQTKTTLPNALADYFTLTPQNFANMGVAGVPYMQGITPREEFLNPRIKQFKLKFILNLKRLDNPNAQNVLYVVTYPIKLTPAPAGYNMIGSDYITDAQTYANQTGFQPQVPTNKFIPATQSELSTLCSGTIYKNNRTNLTGRFKSITDNNINEVETEQTDKLIIYPVPVEDILHLKTFNTKLISILDMNGKQIINLSKLNSTENQKTIDVSFLPKGVYMISYENKNGRIQHQRFIK